MNKPASFAQNPRILLLLLLFTLLPFSTGLFPNRQSTDDPKDTGKNGMVVTAHPLATLAGYQMLQQGGNAVDAAVAAAFAIGVVEPDGSGIGGGGGMVVYLAKEHKTLFINYYQRASENVADLDFNGDEDRKSASAILVPGTVAGLTLALKNYGSLPLATVLAPAIKYAEEGFAIDATLGSIILDNAERLGQYEQTAAVYLNEGFPRMEGELLVQVGLAATLRAVAEKGSDGFYKGPVAEKMSAEVTAAGGALTLNDLASYKAEVMPVLKGTYRGYDIYAANLPQSGASVIEAMNILENKDLSSLGHFSSNAVTAHVIAEALRRVYADRTTYLGDPNFESVPLTGILSKEYARVRFTDIDINYATPKEYRKTKEGNPLPYSTASDDVYRTPADEPSDSPFDDSVDDEGNTKKDKWGDQFDNWGRRKKAGPRKDPKSTDTKKKDRSVETDKEYDGHTTHLSIIDKDGNMVSLTQTLGTFFGSFFISAGVLFNSSMANFSSSVKVNLPKPGKQPRSSIAPLIVMKGGKPVLVGGSPGATRIIATVVELLVNVLDFKMNAREANDAPRLFCQKADDYLHLEKRFSPEVRKALEEKGHNLRVYGDYDLFFGGASLITVDPYTGMYVGAADPRRGGNAMGY